MPGRSTEQMWWKKRWISGGAIGAVVLTLIVAAVMINRKPAETEPKWTGTVQHCQQQLDSLRTYIADYHLKKGRYPKSLAPLDVQGVPDYLCCPSNGSNYIYNPNDGSIYCVNPDHRGL